MGRISNEELYPKDLVVTDRDNFIGTDGNQSKKTKNFNAKVLAKYVATFIALDGVSVSSIPQFSSMEMALNTLGENQRFRWSQNNIDGVPSPRGSQLGVTKVM